MCIRNFWLRAFPFILNHNYCFTVSGHSLRPFSLGPANYLFEIGSGLSDRPDTSILVHCHHQTLTFGYEKYSKKLIRVDTTVHSQACSLESFTVLLNTYKSFRPMVFVQRILFDLEPCRIISET